MDPIVSELDRVILLYRELFRTAISERRTRADEEDGDRIHLYHLMRLSDEEVRAVEHYPSINNFLSRYGGALVEETTSTLLRITRNAQPKSIPNTLGKTPPRFDIDAYVEQDNRAFEVRWRDPRSDGDQVIREHSKILCIREEGMIPVRVVYHVPSAKGPARLQERINTEFAKHGEVYAGPQAWDFVRGYTGFDLHTYLFAQPERLRMIA